MADTIAGMADKRNLTIRLDDSLREQIDRIAEDERRSVSSAVAVLVQEALTARATRRVPEDECRRLLWILASRDGGTLTISDSELTTVPYLPGISVTTDRINGTTEIKATR